MPRYLKLIARFANTGLAGLFALISLTSLSSDRPGMVFFFLAIAGLLGFNQYLIEKAAMLLSEEEWLKGEIRKAFLRRKLKQLASGEIPVDPEERDQKNHVTFIPDLKKNADE